MASGNRPNEFTVRVPVHDDAKNYSVLKFNESLGVDVGNWSASGTNVRMVREDNRTVKASTATKQDYGAGSEFGRAARDEARRKKYGRQLRGYHHDDQPWRLSIEATDGKVRRFRSIRDAGAGDHADYWVFLKSGEGLFDAFKVDDWYQFLPEITHRTLDIDQAEEQFTHRSKVMNQFALKAQIQAKMVKDEDEEKMDTKPKNLKITDKDELSDDEEEVSDSEKVKDEDDMDSSQKKKKKNAKNSKKKPHKDKKTRVENADEVAAYESDDGDDEGREYDYMSDSGSDSDRDNVPMEEKIEKALVGVSEETGLKKMMDSDDEDSSDEDEAARKMTNPTDSSTAGKTDVKVEQEDEEKDSSGSDSDDPDKEKIDSVVFLQRATSGEDGKRDGGKADGPAQGKKRPGGDDTTDGPSDAKRIKTESGAGSSGTTATSNKLSSTSEGLTEEAVRKYLRRKPHTTKELLGKFKPRCQGMSKTDIVTQLAAILKRVQPHQFKQKQGKKEVLFFSLKSE